MGAMVADSRLESRLMRVPGQSDTCGVPSYQDLAREVVASAEFATALKRTRALADENRLVTIALLQRRKELCACEIQAATGLSHGTVSHHMAVLADAGLVRSRREGKWMYYRLAGRPDVSIP